MVRASLDRADVGHLLTICGAEPAMNDSRGEPADRGFMEVRGFRGLRCTLIGIAVVFGGPVLYAVSAGPLGALGQWCYFRGYGRLEMWLWLAHVYVPLDWVIRNGPDWLADPLEAYVNWWI